MKCFSFMEVAIVKQKLRRRRSFRPKDAAWPQGQNKNFTQL